MFKIFKFSIPLILICIAYFALSLSVGQNMNETMSPHGQALYEYANKIGKKLEKKYEMYSLGVGGGATPEGIWLMSISFNRYGKPITETEARKLIISCVDDFLDSINNNDELRPFLKEYPFTSKNLDITIFNFNNNDFLYLFPLIAVVNNSRGKIGYFTEDPSTQPKFPEQ